MAKQVQTVNHLAKKIYLITDNEHKKPGISLVLIPGQGFDDLSKKICNTVLLIVHVYSISEERKHYSNLWRDSLFPFLTIFGQLRVLTQTMLKWQMVKIYFTDGRKPGSE